MSAVNVDNSLSVSPPTAPYTRASSASTVEFELPEEFNKHWLTLAAEGQKFWFRFTIATAGASSGESLDETSVSSLTSEVLQPDADGAFVLEAGQEKHYDLSKLKVKPGEAIKILHKSSATGGYLRMSVSSGPKN